MRGGARRRKCLEMNDLHKKEFLQRKSLTGCPAKLFLFCPIRQARWLLHPPLWRARHQPEGREVRAKRHSASATRARFRA